MKKIFLLIAITAFSFASAQDKQTFYIKPFPLKPNLKSDSLAPLPGNVYIVHNPHALIDQSKLLHTLANGNKVYALPQDNMPCIVPDMTQYGNAGLLKPPAQQYNIPNPAYPPQQRSITAFYPEKLKELQETLKKKGVKVEFK